MTEELLNHLLQSTLFAVVASVLIILFRKGSSWSRHFISWVAFINFLVPFSAISWLIPLKWEFGTFFKLSFLLLLPVAVEMAQVHL